jgi:hypothetical protein
MVCESLAMYHPYNHVPIVIFMMIKALNKGQDN